MAPKLAPSQHAMIHDMLVDGSLTHAEMAWAACCSERAIDRIVANVKSFGTTKAPRNGAGRPRRMTPVMLDALREHLVEKPELYLEEMVVFLFDDFGVIVDTSTVSRALKSINWSKKKIRQIARERNADLRDFYLHTTSLIPSWQRVYVDESGCDKRIGCRKTGWSPRGVRPVQIAEFHRENRYQILPAYTQDGILLSRVYQGSTDNELFEDYLEQLLHRCGRWPEPRSVLIMDNASFHYSERIDQMCLDAGVKLVYLPSYSPDFNPIEEFFAELKSFIKKNWRKYADNPEQEFGAFLEWCISVAGGKKRNVEGHFRHAGVTVEYFDAGSQGKPSHTM